VNAVPKIESGALARNREIVHGFFTREGGVSRGIYASLNCGFGSADAPEAVAENRARAMAGMGLEAKALVTIYQIHSSRVTTVTRPWLPADAPEGDAMVTKVGGIALGILAADCVPVLFADAEAKVIGAAHAGWRGALDGVLEATLAAMEALGAARSRISAAIGPSIGRDAYEVGAEFEQRFRDADRANARFFTPSKQPGHFQFDLQGFAAARLKNASVGTIDLLGLCTYAEPRRFFSYRRATHRGEKDYGRNLSAIALRP
jgi:YfiH family protein